MSEENEINNEEQVENVETTETGQEQAEPTAEERYAELNNKYLRLHA